jgi:hypothetical protein
MADKEEITMDPNIKNVAKFIMHLGSIDRNVQSVIDEYTEMEVDRIIEHRREIEDARRDCETELKCQDQSDDELVEYMAGYWNQERDKRRKNGIIHCN